ncbi:MAG TPA: AAA family ATPase, partial [Candidatus Thermoplasmatota archaeon]|nr:AAA family ATPase [Candidatus Thermoplasmatota archaeon]
VLLGLLPDVPLLLLDEPVEGLDAQARQWLLAWLRGRLRDGCTVVAADHTGLLRALQPRIAAAAEADPVAPPPLPAPAAGPPLVRVREGTARSGSRCATVPAMDLGPGVHAFTGPNGSGKTTLLRALAGLGEVDALVCGRKPGAGREAAMLLAPARWHLVDDTVGQLLRAGDASRQGAGGADGGEAGELQGLCRPLWPRHPLTLSAGEAQRVALARVLQRPARVYLLDEPEAHLDAAAIAALLGDVGRKAAAGACVVVATHDPGILRVAHSVHGLSPSAGGEVRP